MIRRLRPVLSKLHNEKLLEIKDIYPREAGEQRPAIIKNSIYISTPMSCISDDAYKEMQVHLKKIIKILKDNGFKKIYCSAAVTRAEDRFSGNTRVINNNFPQMKQSECMLIIYPELSRTSALMENGYAIALTKHIVIFHRMELPFLLKEAQGTIPNVKIFPFETYEDVENKMKSNGRDLFRNIEEE